MDDSTEAVVSSYLAVGGRRARPAIGTEEFPVLPGRLAAALPAVVDREVCPGALRRLIHTATPRRSAGVKGLPGDQAPGGSGWNPGERPRRSAT
ncbi:hypothetical protein [Streptomyces sp. MUSC 14]|uniref:hypothetical protein n=1 Tax=Streptomyces sp. MUSC 14 TaxID=1354889 RepID=UPI0008F5EAA9|nr:hypothetical protein [Streptomyces sp. MUSC 14]